MRAMALRASLLYLVDFVARFDHSGCSEADSQEEQVFTISKVVTRIFVQLKQGCGSVIFQRRSPKVGEGC